MNESTALYLGLYATGNFHVPVVKLRQTVFELERSHIDKESSFQIQICQLTCLKKT
jgi:hypothetical protein